MLFRLSILLPIAFIASVSAALDTTDKQFLDGLRQRRLLELSETYCRRELERPGQNDRRRVTLAIELLKTLAAQAVRATPEERPARWEAAHQAAESFYSDFLRNRNPRRLLLEVQAALLGLAQGKLALEEARIHEDAAAPTREAQQVLRRATKGLEKAALDVEKLLRASPRRDAGPHGLTRRELASLEKNLSLRLAQAHSAMAHCYKPRSADWVNSLTLALERLEPLAELTVEDSLVWQSRLERARCFRLLGDFSKAGQLLQAIRDARPPASIASDARAEQMRTLLDGKQLAAAAEMLGEESVSRKSSAELDFAILEVQIAALLEAQKTHREITLWQQRAVDQVRRIEQAYGSYWMRRAETLLANSISRTAAGDIEALRRAAESFYRSGQTSRSLAAYDRAHTQAIDQGDTARAFDLAFTAATLEHERLHHQEALARYRRVAETFPKHPRAPGAHLLAIVNLAELVRTADADQRAERLVEYEQLLTDHLRLWSTEKRAMRARFWLGQLRQSRGDWAGAVDAYQGIAPENELFEDAVRGVAECYGRWLEQQKAAGQDRDELALRAIGTLDRIVVGRNREWPKAFSPLQRDVALSVAKIRLAHRRGDFADAERLLREALSRSPDAPETWQSEARILLIYALAGQKKRTEAASVLETVSAGSASLLLSMLEALSELSSSSDLIESRELAELQLGIVRRLEASRADLSADAAQRLDRIVAESLSDSGRRAEALAAYESLAKQYPRDGKIQEGWIGLLSQTDDRETLERALAGWREIQRKSRQGTPRWFRARYAQAEALYRLGQKEKAAKLIRLTRVLHPNLGGEMNRARFERLLRMAQP